MAEESVSESVMVPEEFVIDSLRNEIATLNNERINLTIMLNYQSQLIAAMQARIEGIVDEPGDD